MFEMPKGPFCQSCGMPMSNENLYGTNADSSKTSEYCSYCFQNGAFVAPDITMDEMIKKCTSILSEKAKMPLFMASTIVNTQIPKLKRWQN